MKEETIQFIRDNSKEINERAYNGDNDAMLIIQAWHLHRACKSDPGAIGLLEAAVEDYRKVKP